MSNILISIQIILVFSLLLVLPGALCISLLRVQDRIEGVDPYEKISYGVMLSLAFWIPISFISYQFKANTNYLIYVTVLLTTFTTLYFILRSNFKLPDLFNSAQRIKFNFFSIFNTYTAVIVFQSILVGYTSQYQSGASDALIHIAAIRNMATSENVLNCNAVLGDGTPVLITYGCNPWYLTLGIILRITQVDTALGYSSLTGIVYPFWQFTHY